MKGQGNMHQGMPNGRRRLHAGDFAFMWKGRPVYVPGGGSVDAGAGTPSPAAPPPGTIPITPPPPSPTPPTPLTAEVLAAQRAQWQQETEERLRQQREELERSFSERLQPIEAERAERERLAQEAEQARLEAERVARESEETWAQRAERLQRETDERVRGFEEQLKSRDALLAREQRRNEVATYRSQRLSEEAENIHPAMHEMVFGASEAEVDSAIERAKAASNRMLEEFAGLNQQTSQQLAQLQRQQPGVSPTLPPAGPLEAQQMTQHLTADDIANMSDADYEANRTQLLAAAGQAYRQANGRPY